MFNGNYTIMNNAIIKRLGFTLVLIFLGIIVVNAQQLPLFSQYMMNDFYINPAVAGSKSYSPIVLGVHKQWVGLKETPSTQTVSGHTSLVNNTMGVGGILFHDKYGPSSELGLKAIYAYHFHIDRLNKISLGLSIECYQFKLDQRDFNPTTYDDPSLTYLIEKTIIPDASFGVYAYGKRYYASITGANLFQSKMKINQNIKENKMVRHYFIFGGYKFSFEKNKKTEIELEPSLLFKFTEKTPLQVDVNLKCFIKQDYWIGVSVRPKDSFIVSLGVKYKQYYFGYAYDVTFSDLANYTIGSQEFIFGVNINETTRKHRSFF